MTSHPAILNALAVWRQTRAEYQDYLEAQEAAAETECNGVLLNSRGRAAGIDPSSLFLGPWVRVQAYASRELLDWFVRHGRTTFQDYEAQRTGIQGRHWGELLDDWTPTG